MVAIQMRQLELQPDYMKPFTILYQDANIAVVNKAAGISLPDCQQSLSNFLTMTVGRLRNKDFFITPIGDIDRMMSGIQVFCLNLTIARELESNWNTSRAIRQCVALTKGSITETDNIDFMLKDCADEKQKAVTNFASLQNFGIVSYLRIWTDTDCKHQIRRHFARRNMNIIGDRKFGNKRWNDFFKEEMGLNRLFLHANQLTLDLKSYNRILEISCPLPLDLDSILNRLSCLCQNSIFSITEESSAIY